MVRQTIAKMADQTPQEASTPNSSISNSKSIQASPPHRCWQRSNSTSRLLSTTSARNAFQRRTHRRIVFTAMMSEFEVTDEPHKTHICVSNKLRKFVTTQHVSGQDTGLSSARTRKDLELPQEGTRKSERQLGHKSLAHS